jgi:hypothetical protein
MAGGQQGGRDHGGAQRGFKHQEILPQEMGNSAKRLRQWSTAFAPWQELPKAD